MAIKYCTLHRIGYNEDFDGACPQCVIQGINTAPEQWAVGPDLKPIKKVGSVLPDDAPNLRERK